MNRKQKSLICIVLVIIISIPLVSIVFARKSSRGPPEKIVYVHYENKYAKKEPQEDYKLIVKGAKLTSTAIILINPEGSDLNDDAVKSVIELSAEEWDTGAHSDWGGVSSFDIFDGYELDETADWDGWEDATRDTRNEISFGDYPREGVIAVCAVWGFFGGPPDQREILEFDIMFDTTYAWGDNAYPDIKIMDLQNIATHELGHGLGLGDLYRDDTSEETMFGFSGYGDIEKRSLHDGDIAGIQFLYGDVE